MITKLSECTLLFIYEVFSLVSPPPINVVMERLSSTSIGVSWTKLTLVELKGLANYVVTYNIANSRMRQPEGMVTVPWTQNHVIISNLQPGAEYDITVHTSTEAGMSGSYYTNHGSNY